MSRPSRFRSRGPEDGYDKRTVVVHRPSCTWCTSRTVDVGPGLGPSSTRFSGRDGVVRDFLRVSGDDPCFREVMGEFLFGQRRRFVGSSEGTTSRLRQPLGSCPPTLVHRVESRGAEGLRTRRPSTRRTVSRPGIGPTTSGP